MVRPLADMVSFLEKVHKEVSNGDSWKPRLGLNPDDTPFSALVQQTNLPYGNTYGWG